MRERRNKYEEEYERTWLRKAEKKKKYREENKEYYEEKKKEYKKREKERKREEMKGKSREIGDLSKFDKFPKP